VILCADHGNQSISYAGDLCDAHFIRLRRLAAAAQHTWDRIRCIGAGPRGTNTAAPEGQWIQRTGSPAEGPVMDGALPASERAIFTRAMMMPHTTARVDFMAQFGVQWLDPTADRKLLERLLTFPLHIFRVGNRPRGLARELGRGRLPDAVRLRRARSAHFPDQTAWFTARADDYRKAFQSLRDCSSCEDFLDLRSLEPLLATLCGGGGTPAQATTVHRALDAGLFAAARESGRGREPVQFAADSPATPTVPAIPTLKVFGTGELDSTQRARA
jgi:hypothetical protein